jgi:hypothetical protein
MVHRDKQPPVTQPITSTCIYSLKCKCIFIARIILSLLFTEIAKITLSPMHFPYFKSTKRKWKIIKIFIMERKKKHFLKGNNEYFAWNRLVWRPYLLPLQFQGTTHDPVRRGMSSLYNDIYLIQKQED